MHVTGAGAGRSFLRVIGLTSAFMAAGAVAGALCALVSLAPVWIGPQAASFLHTGSVVTVVAVVGAVCGMVVLPLFGWLLVGRVSFWRIVLELTAGAMIGSTLAWMLAWSVQTDVLVLGAYLGAVAALVRLRVTRNDAG